MLFRSIAGQTRVAGFKQALLNKDLPVNEDYIVYAKGFSFEDGVNKLPLLLQQAPELTAVFAASDEIAMGAMSAAYKMGIKIPEELSIIGYDNLPIAEMCIPPLTTIAQPLEKMGTVAANMLFSMMRSGDIVESRIIPHKVVERESVRNL